MANAKCHQQLAQVITADGKVTKVSPFTRVKHTDPLLSRGLRFRPSPQEFVKPEYKTQADPDNGLTSISITVLPKKLRQTPT